MDITYHHTMPIQLRFMDGDQFGHVNNSLYFQYYDTAKVDYFRAVLPELMDRYAIVVVHIEADFMHQVFTSDKVEVETAIIHIGHKSFTFQQRLVDAETKEEKCVGRTIMVVFDKEKNETVPFQQEWIDAISRYEGRQLTD